MNVETSTVIKSNYAILGKTPYDNFHTSNQCFRKFSLTTKILFQYWCRDCKPFNYTINLLMLRYICSSVNIVI